MSPFTGKGVCRGALSWSPWLGLLLGLRLLAGTFQVGLDRETVEVGGTAVLIYNFSNFGNVTAPPAPTIPGADVSYAGASTQSSFQIINGRTSQQTTLQHRYAIVPKKEGVLTIPATRLTVAGEQVGAPAMQLTVTKGTEAGDVARLVLLTPTNTLYVGQPFVARIQFWHRQPPLQIGNPSLPTDGFVSGRALQARGGKQQIGNEIWAVTEFPVPLSPARAGPLPVGPAQLETIYAVGQRQRGFFGDMFAEQRRFTFASSSNVIDVIAPPAQGQPPGFQGAIGRFSLSVTAQPTSVTVGDPITVRVTVRGQGSLESLALPEFPADSGFRTYAGTNGVQFTDPMNFRGSKVFELAVVPDRADLTALSLPPLVSFDPDTQQYIVAEAPAIALQVKAGSDALAAPSITPTYAANTETNQGPVTAAQLRPLGKGTDRPIQRAEPWPLHPGYWIALATPLSGLAAWSLMGWLIQRRPTDPEALRRAAAQTRAQNAWQTLERAEGADFYAALDNALREQISLTANLPSGAVSHDTIESVLEPRGLDAEAAQRLRRLLNVIDAGRFSPVPTTTSTTELRREAEAVLQALRHLETPK